MKIFQFLLILFLISAAYAVTLSCHFINTNLLLNEATPVYSCFATCSQYDHNHTVARVNGAHDKGKTDSDVMGLMLDDCPELNFVPTNLHTIYPNLMSLRFFNTKIPFLTADDLIKLPKLKSFVANNNEMLTDIPGDLFMFTPNLEYISLAHNSIQTIHENAIAGLRKLEFVNLSNNKCINAIATNKKDVLTLYSKILMQCSRDVHGCSGDPRNIDKRICFIEQLKDDMINRTLNYLVVSDALKTAITNLEKQKKCVCPLRSYFEDDIYV